MPNLPDPTTWQRGDVVLHRDGRLAVLADRKDDGTGWNIAGGGGLADTAAAAAYYRFTPSIGRAVWQLLYLGAVS